MATLKVNMQSDDHDQAGAGAGAGAGNEGAGAGEEEVAAPRRKFFDDRLGSGPAPDRKRRELRFVPQGKYVRKAQAIRAQILSKEMSDRLQSAKVVWPLWLWVMGDG